MVKWRSHLASTEGFRVRVLVGVLRIYDENGRATRQVTGTGWKPAEQIRKALRVRSPPLPLEMVWKRWPPMVKGKSRLGPNEAVRVRLPVGASMVFVV